MERKKQISSMYRVVTGIIERKADLFRETYGKPRKSKKRNPVNRKRSRPDFVGRDYSTTDATKDDNVSNIDYDDKVYLTHMPATTGIISFGDMTVTAILRKFSQINDMKVIDPLNPNLLTPRQKRDHLYTISLETKTWKVEHVLTALYNANTS